MRARRTLAALACGCALAAPACALRSDAGDEAAAAVADPAERSRELEQAIGADRERLRELLSTPVAPGDVPLRNNPDLIEIAERMPELQRELRALESRPSTLDSPSPSHWPQGDRPEATQP